MASSSWSSSDGSSGGVVKVSRGGRSISSSFSLFETETSLGGGSSSASSPVHNNNDGQIEEPVGRPEGQGHAPTENGDVISIDVTDEGEQANLPLVSGYDWAHYEPRTHETRY
ncbi:hypothetical protein DEO72_LG10g3935 [Vigna unguiculata]|uniref:Uncharacterized protein n=1 Tax=Vigna unguiculata TaxID=3917 RepID=A0A4D6NLC0_VIGUN|nr:hypothetical protein DEO72_LG10g3935 [Vigna unguiculata]